MMNVATQRLVHLGVFPEHNDLGAAHTVGRCHCGGMCRSAVELDIDVSSIGGDKRPREHLSAPLLLFVFLVISVIDMLVSEWANTAPAAPTRDRIFVARGLDHMFVVAVVSVFAALGAVQGVASAEQTLQGGYGQLVGTCWRFDDRWSLRFGRTFGL